MPSIAALQWTASALGAHGSVCRLLLDSTLGSSFIVSLLGTDNNGNDVIASFVTIDNMGNPSDLNYSSGFFNGRIAAYTRHTIRIPKFANYLQFDNVSGSVTAIFSESDLGIPDDANSLASGQLAQRVGINNYLESWLLHVGQYIQSGGFTTPPVHYGFAIAGLIVFSQPAMGILQPNTSRIYTPSTVDGVFYSVNSKQLTFQINAGVANAGWTNLFVNNVPFLRTDATFIPGPPTIWQWAGAALTTNPFGTDADIGTNKFVWVT